MLHALALQVAPMGREGATLDMELAKAYADSWPPATIGKLALKILSTKDFARVLGKMDLDAWFGIVEPIRNLKWRSSQWMSPQDWIAQMKVVCPSYNEFKPSRVAKLLLDPNAKGIEVQPAREGSVCVYIKGEPEILDWIKVYSDTIAKADEAHIQGDGTLRLWWD